MATVDTLKSQRSIKVRALKITSALLNETFESTHFLVPSRKFARSMEYTTGQTRLLEVAN